MTTETLRVTASAFRLHLIALWQRALRISRRAPRRLRLCESLPLGERRFVAVVEFEAARFLVGGTASSLVLLSRLADAEDLAREEDRAREEDLARVATAEEREAASRDEFEVAPSSEFPPAAWSAALARKRRGGTC